MMNLMTLTGAEHDAWCALKEGDDVQFVDDGDTGLPDGVVDGDAGTILSIDGEHAHVEVPTSPFGCADAWIGLLCLAGEHPADVGVDGSEHDPDDDDHPSLTAAERNPGLK